MPSDDHEVPAAAGTARRPAPRRRSGAILLVVVLLMVNAPLVHSSWLRWRVDRAGTDVVATLVQHRVVGDGDDPEHWVGFTYPDDIDPGEKDGWTARVDEETYDAAVASGRVRVRVLPDRPSAYSVEGQVHGRVALVVTLMANLLVLSLALLLRRFRGHLRAELRMLATEDLVRCPPGAVLERQVGGDYVVCGDVVEIGDDEVLLEVDDRRVRVVLDGRHNPAGARQSVRARGPMIG